MAVRLRENQYRGVNAHLHSYFQRQGGWPGFHYEHLSHVREAIENLLPDDSGYFVMLEQSLQIAHYDPDVGRAVFSRVISDIGMCQERERTHVPPSPAAATPTAVLPLATAFFEPEPIMSVVVYRAQDEPGLGRPVTRFELLSPANKPRGSHHKQYLYKRNETPLGGIKLVEADYLHEQGPLIPGLPDYTAREADSYPYMIVVSDPLPAPEAGEMRIFGFRVDDPIPAIAVPLVGSDRIVIDLGAVYNRTFASNRAYGLSRVDYGRRPEGFETYDEVDRGRIEARMAAVAEGHRQAD